ncbi:MAG: methylenetetrahydrofolate--tRNA-(uracil(54)-C(5))-methyltransferase (FADH(2)-oxidizing) TrmFO [Bdellovibrionales bacterium GWB1_55_8]|nr:MAG: methylenetetrahydrofolate--tRNA-(uracil(54)-C(5))-methyltransferase (FADH(2)-oxidizing) TrmFO [Bdellovibrionales bacterium GWB1_55_8]
MSIGTVHIVGAGLAGSEAAYFLAERDVKVTLHEMRPIKNTPAHQSDHFAELVCSNSLKSQAAHSAPGILKAEMGLAGSLILKTGMEVSVPAGEALAVDRELFSESITKKLSSHPNVTVLREELTKPPAEQVTLIATGPLSSNGITRWLGDATRADDLYFYDAIAPVIEASSIDWNHAFLANRYGKGDEEAYINCPMNEAEYNAFIDALASAEKVPPRGFEKEIFFQGCQPIEAIAATGRDTLRHGPMKPVGLTDPRTGQRPFAVIQLRAENRAKTAYNLVGFQTKLKMGEQTRIFRMIPALNKAEFLRLGSIHRNTYVCAPKVLHPDLSLRGQPRIYLAGQLAGVEGYLESAACGMLAAFFILQRLQKQAHRAPPANTALGALLRHVTGSDPKQYQPSNMHFGLFDQALFQGLEGLKKDELRRSIAIQALANFNLWWERFDAVNRR